jgi:hypothetical protein
MQILLISFFKKLNIDKILSVTNLYEISFNFNFYNVFTNTTFVFLNARLSFYSFFCSVYHTTITKFCFLNSFYTNKWMLNSRFFFFINLYNFHQKHSDTKFIWGYNYFNNTYHHSSLYLNHHSSILATLSNILIPVSIFIEKSSKYSNLEGFVHQTRRISKKFKQVKYDWTFWFDLFLITYYSLSQFNTTPLILLNYNYNSLLYFLNFKNYHFNFSFIFSTLFLKSSPLVKINYYLLISKILVFEFTYINFINFCQTNHLSFFFIHDFFYFNNVFIGCYFKYSFLINNVINFNSKYLLNAYKKYTFINYSNILYTFNYHNFYI